jgi:3-deoxy-D-manno-octulosonic-acid transferase
MWFSVLYEIVVAFAFLAFLPKALYQCLRYKKHRTNTIRRLGIGFPHVERKGQGPIIWMHAVSVGESQAATALLKRLQEEIPDVTVVVSSTSETGHAEAKKALKSADYHVYLPFDFAPCVKHVLSRCAPDLVILIEGDFWYRFLKEAKKQGAVALVVNGKVSETSCQRFCKVPFFTKRLFSLLDFLCVQSDLYKQRFLAMGIAASKIAVTGNLKTDSLPLPLSPSELEELRARLHLAPTDRVIVVGSTHDPEEELILSQLAPLLARDSHVKIILAPRHPERFELVEALLTKHNIPYASWTKGTKEANPRGILIDAMGVLRKCYQLADVAIVAGSFIKRVGGHNIMEAQAFGVPVVSGPYMHSQPQLIECAKFYDAILQVDNAEVGQAVERLLSDADLSQRLGNNALKMVAELRGATDRTLHEVRELAPQFFACNKP